MPQEHYNTPLGAITNLTVEGQVFHFSTTQAKVQVTIFSDTIIRIRAIKTDRP